MSIEILDDLVKAQKRGEPRGIPSICSSHPLVLQAAMRRAMKTGTPVLIESTCNQVNQYGGYTGMTPRDFVAFVQHLADENGLPAGQLILGGDHLGPSVWQDEPEDSAMNKSKQLVGDYIHAGFRKIHLDASMKLAEDDSTLPLDVEISGRRAARLAKVCEVTHATMPGTPAPRYVIGSEVPVPGGAHEHEEGVSVTRVEDARQTIEIIHAAFIREGLEAAWERVIALVVQPGVEFGDDFILGYQPEKALALSNFIESESRLVYEAHSTDYQTRDSLRDLVRDHFAILKVGPALTFAYREAVFSLAMIEQELFDEGDHSNLITGMDEAMLREPHHWQKYYTGRPDEQAFKRKYSFSDRIRYYWTAPPVKDAVRKLMTNLGTTSLPLTLLSQWLPVQHRKIRSGELENTPSAIIQDKIDEVLIDYSYACGS
jgi:D-tagatose-1,6-bisphosphate aldolase subunit GatZ/KbaZ